MLKKQFNSTLDYIAYLENLKLELAARDYLLNDELDKTLVRFLQTFKLLEDSEEYVPRVYLTRMRDKIYKEFCSRWRQDRKSVKRVKRINKLIDRLSNTL